MKNLTKIIFAVFFTLVNYSVFSQAYIYGKIVNNSNEEGKKITIQLKPEKQTITLNGNETEFNFENIEFGNKELVINYPGFETKLLKFNLTSSDTNITVYFLNSEKNLEEVTVSALRVDQKSPTAFVTLDKKQLQKNNFGQDLPILLETTPSAVSTSDAGTGIGYTGIRVRGSDPSRTNVTINGIPVNDAESHDVYWVNMPDFTSSTESIQIQRGVGSSTNGAAAFGASINIKTDDLKRKSYVTIDNSAGSFSTMRNTVKVGSGLINNRFTLDARLSRILSDGYIDRASSDLKSFYISGAYVNVKSILRANIFSGHERTYQSWYGTPESKVYGTSADQNAYAERNYLSDAERNNLLNSGRSYNYYTYKNQEDNYKQTHYQLYLTHSFTPKTVLTVATHYTNGRGFYEEYKTDDKLSNYGLDNVKIGGDTIKKSDVIRRRWLDNHFYGVVYSLLHETKSGIKFTLGGAGNTYEGNHFGEVIWARYASNSNLGDNYYFNYANKSEINNYLKANYSIANFSFYADAQYRTIRYNYYEQATAQRQTKLFNFFNPKLGFNYELNAKNNFYASWSVGHREPVRKDFIEASINSRPSFEQLFDYEFGYKFKSERWFTSVNGYFMDYNNQLVLTGKINDVGSYTRINVSKSYRAGVELEAGIKVLPTLNILGNLTLSQNKIASFQEYIDAFDVDDNYSQDIIQHSNTDIAFSPNVIGALIFLYEPIKNLEFSLTNKYVGKQYLDNTSSDLRKINPYQFSNIGINYSFSKFSINEIKVGILLNNVFDANYVNNGYTWGYNYAGTRQDENFYYPQAGRNFLVRVCLNI